MTELIKDYVDRGGKRFTQKYLKASFTVEASFIVPIALALMLFVCFTAFWLHDRNVSWINAADNAYHAARYMEDGDNSEKAVSYAAEHADDFLIGNASVTDSLSTGKLIIEASLDGYVGIPLAGWFAKLGWPSFGSVHENHRCMVLRHCELIRHYRLAKKLKGRK